MKKLLFSFLAAVCVMATHQLTAQNYTQFSGYMYNKLHVNPAYAGANGQLDLNVFYRDQWSGIEGAPQTVNVNAHTSIMNGKAGVGLSLVNERIGTRSQNSAVLSYAYRINTGENSKLAIGVSGRFENFNMDFTSLYRLDEGDDQIPESNVISNNVNFGAGIMWHSKKHYVSVSAPTLVETDLTGEVLADVETSSRVLVFMAGKIFDINKDLKIHPSMLFAYFGADNRTELGTQFIVKDRIFIGGNYSFGNAAAAILKYQLSNNLAIGGIYESTTSTLRQVTGSSFEVFAEYSFLRDVSKNSNIRYF